MTHPLRPIFEPRSVAIIGASADPEKRGHQVVAALLKSGFAGRVYPVNPRRGEILGLEVFASIEALPEAPDLAYIARPAAAVPDLVGACGRAGMQGAIVPAVGFRESGAEGARLESDMLAQAREQGIRVIGPNTSGVLNTHVGLHMVGGEPLRAGGLGILAQSGNIALDLMTSGTTRPIGISIYVGPGNETDIGFHEYLEFLGEHQPTRVIAMYIEGVRDGRALFDTLRKVTRVKPVVALKGGRSNAGGRTARSHTGAITGSYSVFRALARECGLIEVERSDELLAVAETLAGQPPTRPPGIAVLSDGGGHATLSADHLTAAEVPLARLADATRSALADLLGPAASVRNPVDVAGASDQAPPVLAEALRLLVADPSCGGVMLTGLFGGYAIRFADALAPAELAAADAIATIAEEAGIPLVVHSLYAPRAPAPLARLLERGVPVYDSLERAVRCIAALEARGALLRADDPASAAARVEDRTRPRPAATTAGDEAPTEAVWLSEHETRSLLGPFGVPLVRATLCGTADEAVDAVQALVEDPLFTPDSSLAAADTGGARSFALKAVSRHLPHKTEAGAVRLGVTGPEAARSAFEDIARATRSWLENGGLPPELDGVLVSPMMPKPLAELLVGARRDPQFGPVLTLALGGTAVELFGDVAIRGLPAAPGEVASMCRELRLAPLLLGYRGSAAADLGAVTDLAVALGTCLLESPDVLEIELNPVFAYPDRAVAIDAVARMSRG